VFRRVFFPCFLLFIAPFYALARFSCFGLFCCKTSFLSFFVVVPPLPRVFFCFVLVSPVNPRMWIFLVEQFFFPRIYLASLGPSQRAVGNTRRPRPTSTCLFNASRASRSTRLSLPVDFSSAHMLNEFPQIRSSLPLFVCFLMVLLLMNGIRVTFIVGVDEKRAFFFFCLFPSSLFCAVQNTSPTKSLMSDPYLTGFGTRCLFSTWVSFFFFFP